VILLRLLRDLAALKLVSLLLLQLVMMQTMLISEPAITQTELDRAADWQ